MDTLCCMVTQLGQHYTIFVPIVKKVSDAKVVSYCLCVLCSLCCTQVMMKQKFNHSTYDLLLVRLNKVSRERETISSL